MTEYRHKKRFGQNFLNDKNVLKDIIHTANLNKKEIIVEIGPGLGILTNELARLVKEVHTVEIDDDLVVKLRRQWKDNKKIFLYHQDVLEFNPSIKNYKLIANIPYYLTSPILRHFLINTKNKPSLMVLMVQLEVAEKICSKKNSILSWEVKLFGKPFMIRKVSKASFIPAPKVDSAILKIEIYNSPLLYDPYKLLQFMKIGFSNKRKKLINNLKNFYKNIDLENIFNNINLSLNARAEELGVQEWESLYKKIIF